MIPITDLTNKQSSTIANKIALIHGKEQWTYHQLHEAINNVAANLLIDGFKSGDRILLCLENSFELVVSILACFKVGIIIVHSYTDYSTAELNYIAENSAFCGIISSLDLFPKMKQLKNMRAVYLINANFNDNTIKPYSTLLKKTSVNLPQFNLNSEQPISISYTSGTTAARKGVIHTYKSIASTMECVVKSLGSSIFERPLINLSLGSNTIVMVMLLPGFWLNGTVILTVDDQFSTVLATIEKECATYFVSFPFYLKQLIHHPDAQKTNFSSLKLALVGGDKVTKELCDSFFAITKLSLTAGFGMTESACILLNLSKEHSKEGSLGQPIYGVEAKIIDNHGNKVPNNVIGQLVIKREALMTGYWNFPEETAKALHNGWLYTGDLAIKDDEGFYWFKGRIKNIIVCDAENISPIEVEEAICQHPAVQAAGVTGIDDEKLGQIVKAFVELKPETHLTAESLKVFLKDLLSPYKIPREIVFVTQLPRTLTGKVERKKLNDLQNSA